MRATVRFGAATAATLILLLPALWNRFPLLQYDTGGYLARWFEGYLVPSRSVVYGLFVAAGWPLNFWPVIVLQAALTVWMIALLLRVYGVNGRPWPLLASVAALTIFTTLPWLTDILLTDIFAGLGVFALHLLLFYGERLNRREQFALVALISFAVATHSATFLVLLALVVAAAMGWLLDRKLLSPTALIGGAGAIALGVALVFASNYALSRKFIWTPGGYGIVFGRLLEDGIVSRYLDRHCPDPRLRLCPYRNGLPRDADTFLWGESVFNELGRFDGLEDEMREIVLGSLIEFPGMQIRTALVAGLSQLASFKTGEGVVQNIWHTYGMMELYTPSVLPALRQSRQQNGELHFEAINAVHVPIAWAALLLMPALAAYGWRRKKFADLGLLAATVLLAVVANAFICGPLSNPHDRYGARLAWLAPLVALLAVARAQNRKRPPGAPGGRRIRAREGNRASRTGGR